MKAPKWLIEPDHQEPDGQLDAVDRRNDPLFREDFAAESPAQVETPKGGKA